MITIPANSEADEASHVEDDKKASQQDVSPEPTPRKMVFGEPVLTYISPSPIPNELNEENTSKLAQKIANLAGKPIEEMFPSK